MFVRTSNFNTQTLGAGLMTRAVACSTYAPGSFGWNQWNCGAGGASGGSTYIPAPAPAPYYPPPPAPAPSAPVYRADDAAAQRAQQEYNARIAAEIASGASARTAAQAQAERDAANAALANARDAASAAFASSSGAADIGAAAYSNFGTGEQKTEFTAIASPDTKMPAWIWLAVAGVGALALSGGSKRRR